MTLTGGKHVPDIHLTTGGALGINRSKVTLNNSVVIGNSDSGIYGYYARISLNNTLVTNNSGSGVRTRYGSITLNQSTVSGNSGSGVSVDNGYGILNQSTVADNGGYGVSSVFGYLRLYQSTVSGNSRTGVFSYTGARLEQTTVSGNSGIGIRVLNGSVILKQCTVTENRSGLSVSAGLLYGEVPVRSEVTLENTILTNNIGLSGNFSGTIDIDGATLTLNASSSLLGNDITEINGTNTSNIFSDSSGLGLLQNNGGPTQTHLPGIRSPVLDAGNNADALFSFDQRGSGFPRIVNGTVDVGAVERQAAPPPPVAQPIPILSLPALLSLIASFVALVGWRQR